MPTLGWSRPARATANALTMLRVICWMATLVACGVALFGQVESRPQTQYVVPAAKIGGVAHACSRQQDHGHGRSEGTAA